jgi:hypothetical protein
VAAGPASFSWHLGKFKEMEQFRRKVEMLVRQAARQGQQTLAAVLVVW